MKKVLVTGADGFIGSHLCEMLIKNNYQVRAFTLYNSFNTWGWLDTIKESKSLEIFSGDIRDESSTKKAVDGCDIVINLAALISIPYSYEAPNSYIDTNIKGTLNLLNSSRENNIKLFLQTSTSEVYGTAQQIPINENHPLNPQSPYAASKVASDKLALSYFYSFGCPVVVVRPFNTFGPRQSLRAVIPNIITQLIKNKKEIKLGSLDTTRDFNYVEDTASGFLSIIKSYKKCIGQEINIGSGFEISISDILKNISEIMRVQPRVKVDKQRLRPKNSEVYRLICDNSKIQELTGWKIKEDRQKSLDLGIKKSIKWYSKKENIKLFKPNIYNL